MASSELQTERGKPETRTRKRGSRPKHVPQRTCIACGNKSGKRELIRVVRTPDREIIVDPTGRANGRGAYLCSQQSCWQTALGRDSLSRALRAPIDGDALTALQEFARSLPAEDPGNAEIQKGEEPR